MNQEGSFNFEEFLKKTGRAFAAAPEFFNLSEESDRLGLSRLVAKGAVREVADDYEEQQREYFGILNPSLVYQSGFEERFQEYLRGLASGRPLWQRGIWVYFPWLSTLAHILDDGPFQAVRTARNRNLITKEEQEKFYNATIGIAGLSVGNSVALAIVLQGGGRHIRIADHDRFALSNLNRVRAGVESLGAPKTIMTARQIYALNPYAKVEIFSDGLQPKNIAKFFDGPPKLDIVIDEIDNLAVKCIIREHARRCGIAVVMAADNGDNGVVDIERYDEEPATDFFHGRMGEISYDMLSKLDKFGIGKLITKHVGAENVTERMQESLFEMGKTIVSWPQLGGAALLNGSAAAYCVRKILNKQPLENNRALISLDEKLIPGYASPEQEERRMRAAEGFKKNFGL